MRGNGMVVLFVTVLAAFLAFALWYSSEHPRVITATGQIIVESRRPPFQRLTLRTRDVSINGVSFQEVELPGGTWIGCAGDCRKAVREAREDFWDTQDNLRR